MIDPLDGRIGEAWSGEVPNGSHINVVLARRGSPTAAAAAGALAGPRPGHVPFLACLSPGVARAPGDDRRQQVADRGRAHVGPITWGAAQLGIAQGVLDAVADGLIDPAEVAEVVVLVAVWVDPGRARRDRGQARRTARRCAARSPTRCSRRPRRTSQALVERREDAANTYYTGD